MALSVLAAAFSAGCGSLNAPPVPLAETISLKGARLALVVPESPSFLARTPSRVSLLGAIGGVLGAAAQLSEGDRLVNQFAITDPALATGQGLAARLRASYGMVEVLASVAPVAKPLDTVVAAAPQADLILDVRSEVFGFNYMPKSPSTFFVMSTSWARLIDVQSRKVLAEARCIPTDGLEMTTLERLLENNGQGIKSGLAAYVEPCVAQLAAKMKL